MNIILELKGKKSGSGNIEKLENEHTHYVKFLEQIKSNLETLKSDVNIKLRNCHNGEGVDYHHFPDQHGRTMFASTTTETYDSKPTTSVYDLQPLKYENGEPQKFEYVPNNSPYDTIMSALDPHEKYETSGATATPQKEESYTKNTDVSTPSENGEPLKGDPIGPLKYESSDDNGSSYDKSEMNTEENIKEGEDESFKYSPDEYQTMMDKKYESSDDDDFDPLKKMITDPSKYDTPSENVDPLKGDPIDPLKYDSSDASNDGSYDKTGLNTEEYKKVEKDDGSFNYSPDDYQTMMNKKYESTDADVDPINKLKSDSPKYDASAYGEQQKYSNGEGASDTGEDDTTTPKPVDINKIKSILKSSE